MGVLRTDINYCMLNEQALKEAIYEKKHDRKKSNQGGGRSGISKPTEAEALYNLASVGNVLVNDFYEIAEPERMLLLIRVVKAYFNDNKYGKVYNAKYVLKLNEEETCRRLKISPATYFRRTKAILDYAEEKWSVIKWHY